jgi:hypothetical protein
MPSLARPRSAAVSLAAAGLAAGCGAAAASAPPATVTPATAARPVGARMARQPIDRLTAIARARYGLEAHGPTTRARLHRVGRDPMLLRALASGDLAATRAYARRTFAAVWYGWHVSRLRITSRAGVIVDIGVPFVVAPARMTLRDRGGRPLGTLEVSIQDEIGFVRFMHRNVGVDVVVRGRGHAHVRSSLSAAARVHLPARGNVTLAGRRYAVRSFPELALGGEPVTVWILKAA